MDRPRGLSRVYPSPLTDRLPAVFAGSGRPVLEALAALEREFALATRPGIEHRVAHTKLAWWRAEVERLARGAPEHPLTKALGAAARATPDWRLLNERLDAADLALGGFVPATLAELEALLYRTHGSLEQLGATLLAAHSTPVLLEFGASLGKALGLIEWLCAAAPPGAPAIARSAAGARAQALLDSLDTLLPPRDRAALPGAFVAAALAHAALVELGSRGEPARPDSRGSPGAIVQVFIAWRAARRALRTDRHAP